MRARRPLRAALAVVGILAAGCLPDLGPASAAAHADACGTCHPVHAAELAGSRHGSAATSDLFVALRDQAERELGAGARCDRCHTAFDGERTCLACHDALDHEEPANGRLIADPTGPVRGPFGDTSSTHASAVGLLSDSAICGTCHDQHGFAGFDEHPYQAWLTSRAAADGARCQDCHGSPVPGQPVARPVEPVASGGPPRPRTPHGFQGLSGPGGPELLARGVLLERTIAGVRLTNLTGHGFPDGASAVRELWLESRAGGSWTGDRRYLQALLLTDGVPVANPVTADSVVPRGLSPDEVREEPFPAGVDEVCLRFRPVSEALSAELGHPVPPAVEVLCR